MNEIISALVGLFAAFSSAEPPRDALMHFVIGHLYTPDQPSLKTQAYFDLLGPFVFIASCILLGELIYRLFKLIKGEDTSYHLRQFGMSAGFLTILVASLPAMLLESQSAVTKLCGWVTTSLTGSEDPEALYRALSPLTGNGIVDLGLGAVEIVFLMIFAMAIVLIPLFLGSSAIFLILAVGMRWMGDLGANLLRFSLSVALYSICGGGIYLLVLAGCEAIGKTWTRDQFGQGLFNVGVIIFTTYATVKLMSILKDKLKAVVSGAVSTLNKTKGAIKNGIGHIRGTKDQIRDAISSRTNRSGKGAMAAASAKKFKPAASETTTGKEEVSVMDQEKTAQAKVSTTASRSRHRLTGPQTTDRKAAVAKLSTAAAAALATKSPAAILAAAETAKQVVKPKQLEQPKPSPAQVTPAPAPATPPPTPVPAVPARNPASLTRATSRRPRPAETMPLPPLPAARPSTPPQPIQAPASTQTSAQPVRRGTPRPRPSADPTDPRRR